MEKSQITILSSIFLLLLIPGIASNNVFGEKLLVSDGFDNPIQISALDKTTGVEIQLFSDDFLDETDVFIGSMDFSPDGFLIAASSDNKLEEAVEFTTISLIIEDGIPTIIVGDKLDSEDLDLYCTGFSFGIGKVAYCMNGDQKLLEINFEDETELTLSTVTFDESTFDDIEGDESLGNALAVGPDGTIYLGNQVGLFTVNSDTGDATLVVSWDYDGNEEIDEPNVPEGERFEFGYGECIPSSMDFDLSGTLYATMSCDETPILAKIGLVSPITIEYTPEGEEPYSTTGSDLTLFILERNQDVDFYDFELQDMQFTDPIALSPFDFDFLLGNTYGVVNEGFDSITATVNEDGNYIATKDTAEISICDNAELELSDGVELFVECNNTTIIVDSGSIIATLEADDKEIKQLMTTLGEGDAIVFDSLECELTNISEENDIYVDFEGETNTIVPEDTFSCLKAIDHYLGYDVKDKARHHHDKTIVNLVDEFAGDVNYEVKKVKRLFNPAQVTGGEEIGSEESHLVSYDIKKIKGEPKFEKIKNISVTNQFGDLTVDIKDPKQLLVPSAKSHDAVPEELEKIVINHFKCYDAKESKHTPKFEKRTVDVDDQFGSVTMQVDKVKSLCSPVDKNSEGVVNEENYLMCYDLKEIKDEPKFQKINVFTNNQFGPEELEAKKQKQLCVPSTIVFSDPSEPIIITGTHDGNLEVGSDQVVIIDGATINGNIKNDGGDISMINDCEINGNVKSNNGGTISIDSCIVNGNVQTQAGSLTILNDSEVTGNINAKEANFVTITNNDESFGGHLRVENAGTVDITNNNVAENLRVKTSGDVTLNDNTVGGHLRSFDNISTTVTGNIVTGNLNTGGTDTVTTTGNIVTGNIRAADSISVDIIDNTSGENLRVKDSSNVTIDQNEVGINLRILENDQVSVTNNHANEKINIKDNTDCSYYANTADGKISIKDCTETT